MLKKTFIFFVILAFLIVIGFIFWVQKQRYNPQEICQINIENSVSKKLSYGDSLSLLMWNISYGGMPAQMDFFYSGGIQIRLDEAHYRSNFKNILSEINLFKDSIDIFLFHKVDSLSYRSYSTMQYQEIQRLLPNFESSFCLNFSNPFIPVPLNDPIGKLYSGMLSMSKFHADYQQRISFTNKQQYAWPKRLFTAQKCISLAAYPLSNKKLFVLNVHLNSYDWQGEIRLSQLAQINKIADSLYQDGNFVIISGGWNMNPPGFKKYRIKYDYKGKPAFPEIDSSEYFSSWQFAYETSIPTSRSLKESYRHGAISTTIKDFFICSPNISIMERKTLDQRFQYSDHQAIYLKVLLLPAQD